MQAKSKVDLEYTDVIGKCKMNTMCYFILMNNNKKNKAYSIGLCTNKSPQRLMLRFRVKIYCFLSFLGQGKTKWTVVIVTAEFDFIEDAGMWLTCMRSCIACSAKCLWLW